MVEVIVASALIMIVLVALSTTAYYSLKVSDLAQRTSIANNLAKDALEALRSYRDGTSWASGLGAMAPDYIFHLEKSAVAPYSWVVVPGQEAVNGYTRTITIEDISRNPSTGQIEDVYNLSNRDAETKKATIIIAWGQKQVKISTYLTNWNE